MSNQTINVSKTATVPRPVEALPTAETVRKAMVAFAKRHKLGIRENEVSLVETRIFTIAHAPVAGIERYTDADFAKGVPIQLIFVNSRTPVAVIPNGTYLVRAQFRVGASEGKVEFLGANAKVAVQRDLIIRTRKEAAIQFPDVYTEPIADIPVITSTHVWVGDQTHVGDPIYGHWGVDCAGWQPYRVLYYWA